jgi:predicted DNA binding protein
MMTVAEFTVESHDVPLRPLFEQLPDATMELERVVPTDSSVVPYFWIRGAETDAIVSAFRHHPDLNEIKMVDEVDGSRLIRAEWDLDRAGLLRAIIETRITLLSATGDSTGMTLRVRAEESEQIRAFQSRCDEYGVPVSLANLHALTPTAGDSEYGLTGSQREALVLAYSRGYYETPREVTLAEIAGELGITGQSLGSRLRRGTHRLIENTLGGSSSER